MMRTAAQTQHLTFFKLFLRNPVTVGAIAPSSRTLTTAMTSGIVLAPGEAVVELGPGTGAFTERIRRELPSAESYLGIEREPRFVRLLEKRFPDLRFEAGCAEDVGNFCSSAGLGPVKAIISGLPFVGVRERVYDEIIGGLQDLMVSGSIFRTFQYLHTYLLPSAVGFRRKMNTIFGRHHRGQLILKNLPPVFVLTWTRQR
ncbi:MAG TPA: hypothetical protein PLZ73_11750 [bacterium]|nr:hypothetical protein [bacterium]